MWYVCVSDKLHVHQKCWWNLTLSTIDLDAAWMIESNECGCEIPVDLHYKFQFVIHVQEYQLFRSFKPLNDCVIKTGRIWVAVLPAIGGRFFSQFIPHFSPSLLRYLTLCVICVWTHQQISVRFRKQKHKDTSLNLTHLFHITSRYVNL